MVRARIGLVTLALLAGVSCRKQDLTNRALANQPIPWLTRTTLACEAAAKSNKPLLFFWAADWDLVTAAWDHGPALDPRVREVVNNRYVPLRVDRSKTWSGEPMSREDSENIEEARTRFRPWASKYGSIFIVAPDCRTRLDDFSDIHPSDEALLRRLEASQDASR